MKDKLLHTPEGVRDIYDAECARKMIVQERLHEVIRQYGYQPIQTPAFEFFDVFSSEIGTTPSRELFKFFDREGNTLALRPDITPSIARAVAKYFREDKNVLRFSYLGNTYINNSSYQGRLKESTQVGAELIGDDSVDADAEMIALTIECFLKAGLSEFQISLGHVGFYKAICEAAGIDKDTEKTIRDLICTKNYYAADEILEGMNVSSDIIDIFEALPTFTGGIEDLNKAKAYVENIPAAGEAIDRLVSLYDVLKCYGYESYIAFDLSFLNIYDYYTGIIFDGYTFGSGEAIVKGGRYDDLLSYFGKQAPAVGAVVMIDQLMNALNRQKIEVEIPVDRILIAYNQPDRAEAIRQAKKLREQGRTVILFHADACTEEECRAYAEAHDIAEVMILKQENKE
jgi:ATP phosphoribosyltransferase regulatory subunit